jgi:hypothetical protein
MAKLTVQDPVGPEILRELTALDASRIELADQLLGLEQEKMKILAAAHTIEIRKKKVFERVLSERDLPSDAQITIDFHTGVLNQEA